MGKEAWGAEVAEEEEEEAEEEEEEKEEEEEEEGEEKEEKEEKEGGKEVEKKKRKREKCFSDTTCVTRPAYKWECQILWWPNISILHWLTVMMVSLPPPKLGRQVSIRIPPLKSSLFWPL